MDNNAPPWHKSSSMRPFILIKFVLCSFFLFVSEVLYSNDEIKDLAAKSFQSQIIKLREGLFLKAGEHQFNTLWTRDFAYSVESLLFQHKEDVVKNHLNFLLNHLNETGLVPLYADSAQPMARVAWSSLKVIIPHLPSLKLSSPLKVYYKVAGRYPVIDSNALVIIAACLYFNKTQDLNFLLQNKKNLIKAFNYYNHQKDSDGLIVQPPFSDWQDSARRSGKIFLTNLLYWKAATQLSEVLGEQLIDSENLMTTIKKYFLNQNLGLFLIDPKSNVPRRALEDQLFAIHFNFLSMLEQHELFNRLKQDPLWTTSGPGRASFPSYDDRELNWYVKFAGVKDYHGPLHWSWLWGLTGIVALELNDIAVANDMHSLIENVLLRDRSVGEVYFPSREHELFKKGPYKAEIPFAWGSAYVSHFLALP